ncbi:hypothetical protein [Rhodanobacter sp. MP7CTX1]|uniref:hypothetical protein n=1 Tax=Rhodanobacter sp. MP7CTX1 TaxID=2723084 RepID=UPI00160C3981|nr:hypothetical protein [Rhodanobacter sp. MP7CTX1]MBB6187210.1 hypothetical protein [Rhodanobacter sp. MP7CTX1]
MSTTITVTVTGSSSNYNVTVSPNKLNVDSDGSIVWQAGTGTGSVAFTFDSTTPVSFVGTHAPLTTPAYNSGNNIVSCTDTISGDGTYPYVLTLWVGTEEITWPSVTHVGNGDPEIHNKPK